MVMTLPIAWSKLGQVSIPSNCWTFFLSSCYGAQSKTRSCLLHLKLRCLRNSMGEPVDRLQLCQGVQLECKALAAGMAEPFPGFWRDTRTDGAAEAGLSAVAAASAGVAASAAVSEAREGLSHHPDKGRPISRRSSMITIGCKCLMSSWHAYLWLQREPGQ